MALYSLTEHATPPFHAGPTQLIGAGLTVWYDEAVLAIGDNLRPEIDKGLTSCDYGIVIVSPSFLNKAWTQRELDGLVALEVQSGKTKIIPILHYIDQDTVVRLSPTLAGSVAGKSSEGIPALVKKVLAVVR